MGNGFESIRSVRERGGIHYDSGSVDRLQMLQSHHSTVVVKNDGTVWAMGLSPNYLDLMVNPSILHFYRRCSSREEW